MSIVSQVVREIIAEANVQKMGRKKIIRARVRGGKVQRRKVVSAVKGYTIRSGKLIRMSPAESRRRKLGQRKGKKVPFTIKVENVAARTTIRTHINQLPTPISNHFSFAPIYHTVQFTKRFGNFPGVKETFTVSRVYNSFI